MFTFPIPNEWGHLNDDDDDDDDALMMMMMH